MDGFSLGILGFMVLLACPLMMGGMMLFGWIAARRASASGEHSGHHMGCHMMGHRHTEPRQEREEPLSAEKRSHFDEH